MSLTSNESRDVERYCTATVLSASQGAEKNRGEKKGDGEGKVGRHWQLQPGAGSRISKFACFAITGLFGAEQRSTPTSEATRVLVAITM